MRNLGLRFMSIQIRKATANDADKWSQLLKEALGSDPVAEQVYHLSFVAAQLIGHGVEETWVAEVDGKLCGSISILASGPHNINPVANVGRYLALPEIYRTGAAEALLNGISESCLRHKQIAVMRVPASDHPQQELLERLGFVCVGFQPLKHLCMVREGMLFYARVSTPAPIARLPISQPLPQITELAWAVLSGLELPPPEMLHNGLTGYPLVTDAVIEESTAAAFDAAKLQAQAAMPPVEISGYYSRGLGVLRVATDTPLRVLLARRGDNVVAGISYYFDEQDKCARLVDAFATDNLSTGALLNRVVKLTQDKLSAVYLEVDFLVSAPRILKSAEQIGFVPVAYLPGFYNLDGCGVDLVKMVKLNAVYTLDNVKLTAQAQTIVEIVDRNFQDQKVGLAVINLLRGLRAFEGLGDGELAKVARLFVQKLYRPGEKVFKRGDASNEAYVVMRGQVDIHLEENSMPIASIGAGAIIGEQGLLDGSPRNAFGVASQPSILVVVQREAFNMLVQTEPHLGMAVMRNIATDISAKLRKANLGFSVGGQ
jgi:CRP/FNR family cyclic AMP-dependent transcriptional regulator